MNTSDALLSTDRISIHFNVDKPIEIGELNAALAGISKIYQRTVKENSDSDLSEEEFKLFITKLERNCVFTELAALTAASLPLVGVLDIHNTFNQFLMCIRTYISFFSNRTSNAIFGNQEAPNLHEAQAVAAVLELAKSADDKAELSFEHITYEEGKRLSATKMNFSSKTIDQAYVGVCDHIKTLTDDYKGEYENVVLEMSVIDRKRSSEKGTTYDKGIISDIHSKEVRVHWESALAGQQVKDPENSLKDLEYIVDVHVTRNSKGVPRIYKITKIHAAIDVNE